MEGEGGVANGMGSDGEMEAALRLVDAYLQGEYRHHQLPGLAFGVVYDQDLVSAGGFGFADREAQIPAGSRTLFSVASITKLFTATMLMQLRDAGKVHLDDAIERFIPGLTLRARGPDPQPLTFWQVASHTAGLVKEAPFLYWHTREFASIQEVLATLSAREVGLPPFTEFKYSNLGYMLIGHACELIAGQPYVEYQSGHILDPIGMARSGFESSDEVRARAAVQYLRVGDGFRSYPAQDEGALLYAGGLYSTIEDLARFAALQFRDGPAGSGQILGGVTLREMRTPMFVRPDWRRGVGIGWWVESRGDRVTIAHTGSGAGLDTAILLVPEVKLGVIILTNTNTDVHDMCHTVLDLLVPVARREAARRHQDAPAPAEWNRYVGRHISEIGAVHITMSGGGLRGFFDDEPGELFSLMGEGHHRFRACGGYWSGEPLEFEVDENGIVTALYAEGGQWRRESPLT